MNSETCVCCGREIPEGRQVCLICEENSRFINYNQNSKSKCKIMAKINKAIRHILAGFFYCSKDA